MEYTNTQIRELIMEHLHNQVDRKMTYERLVNGLMFEKISEMFQLDIKTVRKRIHRCEEEIFRHIPG